MIDFKGLKLEVHPDSEIIQKIRDLVYKRGSLYKEVSQYDEEALVMFIVDELTKELNKAVALGMALGKS